MEDYFLELADTDTMALSLVAEQVYGLVCRTDFSKPGFALIRLPQSTTSTLQRRVIVDLKGHLSSMIQTERGAGLNWFNMTRFDQKNTTKLHRDGAPSESLLILGYEPSKVHSEVIMADFSRCAHDMGISPDQFLEDFNPMYEKGLEKLAPFICRVSKFEPECSQILVINNSSNPLRPGEKRWQGVLHSATVAPDEGSRVINSTCAAPVDSVETSSVTERQVAAFLNEDKIEGRYSSYS